MGDNPACDQRKSENGSSYPFSRLFFLLCYSQTDLAVPYGVSPLILDTQAYYIMLRAVM